MLRMTCCAYCVASVAMRVLRGSRSRGGDTPLSPVIELADGPAVTDVTDMIGTVDLSHGHSGQVRVDRGTLGTCLI